jgi:hypothetical protein
VSDVMHDSSDRHIESGEPGPDPKSPAPTPDSLRLRQKAAKAPCSKSSAASKPRPQAASPLWRPAKGGRGVPQCGQGVIIKGRRRSAALVGARAATCGCRSVGLDLTVFGASDMPLVYATGTGRWGLPSVRREEGF